ncbi:MAG: glycosyltransferase [Solobacterium sp.]|nr:glycosyltransferase [Solobacterium sp.]
MKLQNLLLPKVGVCTEASLFYHREEDRDREVQFSSENNTLTFVKYAQLFFDSYFNSLSITKWKKYTTVDTFSLTLELSGEFEVFIANSEVINNRVFKKLVSVTRVESEEKKEFTFPIHLYEYKGNINFELKALKDGSVFYGGYYSGEVDEENLNEVNIAINITTFRREPFVKRNIDILRKNIIDNPESELYGHLRVYISDNGQTLPREELNDAHVRIVPNKNVGGAGGFSRGLMEILRHQDEYPATHALMMDDDIVIEPEALIRTYNVLRCRKPEYSELFVGGAMLRIDSQNIQVESGSSWNAGNLHSNKANVNLTNISEVLNNEIEEYTEFNAWWYCCTPLSVVNMENLPLPIFIRGDDLEYGLRNMKDLFLMNGICVWHEPFEYKYSSFLSYYILRNLLYDNSIHFPNYSKGAFIKRLWRNVGREVIYYRYKNADLLFRGVEDFYKGVDFLKTTDGEALHKEIMGAGYKAVPMDELGVVYSVADYNKALKERDANTFLRKLRAFTGNGWLYPARKAKVVPMAQLRPYNLYHVKTAINYDPISGKGFITQKSWKEAFRVTGKLISHTFKALFKFDKAKNDFANRYRELTNEEFWNEYLKQESM